MAPHLPSPRQVNNNKAQAVKKKFLSLRVNAPPFSASHLPLGPVAITWMKPAIYFPVFTLPAARIQSPTVYEYQRPSSTHPRPAYVPARPHAVPKYGDIKGVFGKWPKPPPPATLFPSQLERSIRPLQLRRQTRPKTLISRFNQDMVKSSIHGRDI
jgi:hypothetical protein